MEAGNAIIMQQLSPENTGGTRGDGCACHFSATFFYLAA